MAYEKQTWTDRQVQYPNRYIDQNGNILQLIRSPGEVTEEGSLSSAERMNHIEDGIENVDKEVSTVDKKVDNLTGENSKIVFTDDTSENLLSSTGIKLNPTIERYEKSINYSSEEQVVGKWINNKKIYKKTLIFSSGWSLGNERKIDFNIQNIDFVLWYEAFYIRSDDTSQIVPNVHPISNSWYSSIYDIKPTDFTFFVGNLNDSFTIKELYVTLYYIKTTD